jgi:hypothetical protein
VRHRAQAYATRAEKKSPHGKGEILRGPERLEEGMNRLLVALVCAVAVTSSAQGTEVPGGVAATEAVDANTPESKAAKALVTTYLNAVKAKRWAEAKKLLHPKALAAIAERKKRLGKEDHPLAPWYLEKTSSSLMAFTVKAATLGPNGTIFVETSEDNLQLEEKAVAEGEPASYLVGRQGGAWWVVDKKRGERFSADSVKLGYRGWFDEPTSDHQ